jgi:hypothetical protein
VRLLLRRRALTRSAASQVDAVWAEVWPSAVAMAQELLECPGLVTGARGACRR